MKEQHENMVQLIRYQAASIPGDIFLGYKDEAYTYLVLNGEK
jgi:hypothetical protein